MCVQLEFGAVLLNLINGSVVSEFQRYVRPTMNPILSDYCMNLTGIRQDVVDRQGTFPLAFVAFKSWLGEHLGNGLKFATPYLRNGFNVAFCTWTNYDLNHFIRLDFKRNGINPPPEFKAWIDARKLFEVSCKSKGSILEEDIVEHTIFAYLRSVFRKSIPFECHSVMR